MDSELAVVETAPETTATIPARKRKAAKKAKAARSKGRGRLPLSCRYCGSDDLAPSFKKRRDRRCRSCFGKRYRSGSKKPTRRGKRAGR